MKDQTQQVADWKIHLLAFVLTMLAEFIGVMKFDLGLLKFSLFPMLYVLVFGVILGIAKKVPMEMMEKSSTYIGISVMLLTAKIGSSIGPNLMSVFKAGPALILQEFGNLGTAVLAMPFAIFAFKMGRAAVGCSFSNSRETSIAIIADKYGLDSEEGIGVMGGYVTGTVLGTLFYGLLVSLLGGTGLFHPYALAMACGTGSASMMSASLGAVLETLPPDLVAAIPDLAGKCEAYAATSNMLSTVDGLYMGIFMALPLSNWMYKLFTKNNKNYKDGRPVKKANAKR